MAKLKLRTTILSKLSTLARTEGNLVITRDGETLYFDTDTKRFKISDFIDVADDNDRLAILAPNTEKMYYVLSTNAVWRYISGVWYEVTSTEDISDIISSLSNKADSNKAYLTDDSTSTDIADGDYIPLSSSANAKKKSTFSNFVAKIKAKLITDTYSGTSTTGMSGKAVKSAIDALDGTVSGSPSASKTLTAFSQTDGKVSATFGDINISKSQINDFPTIPTVNDATLNIQLNGTTVDSFTANASSNVTANIKAAVNNELNTEDLDTVKTPGFYVGKNGNTCTNKPSGVMQFGLYVVKLATSNNNYWKQTLVQPKTVADGGSKTYSRSQYNGTWTDWVEEKYTDTDTKVTQTDDTTSTSFLPLLIANSATSPEDATARKNTNLSYKPSTQELAVKNDKAYNTYPIIVNMSERDASTTGGQDIKVLQVKYKTHWVNTTEGTEGDVIRTTYPISVIGNDSDSAGNNHGIRLGSVNGTTIVGAGESCATYASAQKHYNDENLYLTADGSIVAEVGLANNSLTSKTKYSFGDNSSQFQNTIDQKKGTAKPTYLQLGNATSKDAEQTQVDGQWYNKNSYGVLRLYGQNTNYGQFYDNGYLTGNRYYYLPDKTGTLALTSDIIDEQVKLTEIADAYGSTVIRNIALTQGETTSDEVDELKKSSGLRMRLQTGRSASSTSAVTLMLGNSDTNHFGSIRFFNPANWINLSPSSLIAGDWGLELPCADGTLALQEDFDELGAKNLLNIRGIGRKNLGVTSTVNADGTITLNGTATGDGQAFIYNYPSIPLSWLASLRLSLKVLDGTYTHGSSSSPTNLYLVKNGSTFQSINIDLGDSLSSVSGVKQAVYDYGYTTEDGYLNLDGVMIFFRSGDVFNNLKIGLMLTLERFTNYYGFTAFRPFTKTNRELTLDSEKSVNWEEQNVLGAKNLIAFPYYNGFSRTTNNVTFNVDEKGWITVGGTQASANTAYNLVYDVPLANGTYTLSDGGVGTSNAYLSLVYYTGGSSTANYYDVGADGSVTFTANNWDKIRIRLYIKKNTTVNNLVFKPMLRLESIDDDTWTPYASTNYDLTMNKLSLSSVGTIENSATASRAYNVNEFMIWRGSLYRVKSAIASGATITASGSGANVTSTTLSAEIKAIRDALNI